MLQRSTGERLIGHYEKSSTVIHTSCYAALHLKQKCNIVPVAYWQKYVYSRHVSTKVYQDSYNYPNPGP